MAAEVRAESVALLHPDHLNAHAAVRMPTI